MYWKDIYSIMEIMKLSDASLLDVFVRVHRLGSFSRVADQMNVTPSFISKKISQLEATLRVTLFRRTTRKVQLTEKGRQLIPIAEKVIENLNYLESEVEQEKKDEEISGTLRISSPETYANSRLVSIISEFCKAYPLINIDLILTNSFLNLTEENIDLAIRIYKPKDSSLKSFKLESNDLVFCASPTFLKKTGSIKTIKQLQKYPIQFLSVHGEEKFKKSGQTVQQLFKKSQVSVNSGETLNQFCIQGQGIALRSLWDIRRYKEEKKLVQLHLDDEIVSSSSVYVVFPDQVFMPQKTRLFLDYIKANR